MPVKDFRRKAGIGKIRYKNFLYNSLKELYLITLILVPGIPPFRNRIPETPLLIPQYSFFISNSA